MEKIKIKFAKHQKLPIGYKIEWWEADEHFHWVIDDDNYSCSFASKWDAYRSAWAHCMGLLNQ